MEKSFETAPIWGVVWRFILYSLTLGVAVGLLGVWLLPSLVQDPSQVDGVISLALSLVFYGSLYSATKVALEKKNYSFDAIIGDQNFTWENIGKYSVLALLIAITGYTFSYVILSIAAFLPSFREILGPILLLSSSPTDFLGKLNLFITAVILAPIVEEIFFRGLLTGKFAAKYGNVKGVIYSALIFMIIHIPSFLIPQLLLGLGVGFIYLKTKKIIYPILIHAVYNLIIVLPALMDTSTSGSNQAQEVYQLLNPSGQIWWIYIGGCVIFLLGLLMLVYFWRQNQAELKEAENPYQANLSQAPDFIKLQDEKALENQKALEDYRKLQAQNQEELLKQKAERHYNRKDDH